MPFLSISSTNHVRIFYNRLHTTYPDIVLCNNFSILLLLFSFRCFHFKSPVRVKKMVHAKRMEFSCGLKL